VPGSPIAVAFADGTRDEFDGGRLAIFAAEDHLRTILVVADAGVLPGFALYSVLRGAVEALARAAYLLEPTSVTERRAHALNLRLENLLEQAKVKRDDAKLAERRQHLEARAGLLGVHVLRSRPGRTMGFGEARLLSKVDLVAAAMDDGELAYRLMSGYGHSIQWALLQVGRAQSTDDPDVASIPTDLNVPVFVGVLDRVVALHDRLLARWFTLAGQPVAAWTAAKGP
jgi:hypothetical protein